MTSICRLLPHLLFIAVVSGTGAFEAIVWGQDDWEVEEDAPARPGPLAPAASERPENAFDQMVFRGNGNARQEKKRLESLLTLQVESVELACGLSDAQKRKLQLAGCGDMKRFFGSVEENRKMFRKVRNDRNKINQFWQDIQPLQAKLNSGFFDDVSLFHKVLRRTLDSEQFAKYEQQESERRKFRYEAKIGLVVAMLENGMPLRDEQRQRFVKLLVDETQPPRRFGQSQYDYYVVLFQAAKLPENKLKPIFDDAQWRALSQQFAQAKAMERTLRKNGIVP